MLDGTWEPDGILGWALGADPDGPPAPRLAEPLTLTEAAPAREFTFTVVRLPMGASEVEPFGHERYADLVADPPARCTVANQGGWLAVTARQWPAVNLFNAVATLCNLIDARYGVTFTMVDLATLLRAAPLRFRGI